MTMYMQAIMPSKGVTNYLIHGVSTRSHYWVMLKRTKILACMPESQPHGGDAHTADCQLRRV